MKIDFAVELESNNSHWNENISQEKHNFHKIVQEILILKCSKLLQLRKR